MWNFDKIITKYYIHENEIEKFTKEKMRKYIKNSNLICNFDNLIKQEIKEIKEINNKINMSIKR